MIARRFSKAGALAVAAVAAVALPASAQQLGVSDPVGDAGGGLDMTRVVVDNQAHAVVATVDFVALKSGDVVISIDRRAGRGLRLVSIRKADGRIRSFVAEGAFTDRHPGGRVSCPGFRVDWDEDQATATLRMPSQCLNHGDFGDIRFQALTEALSGGDADEAPQTPTGELRSSAWIPRG